MRRFAALIHVITYMGKLVLLISKNSPQSFNRFLKLSLVFPNHSLAISLMRYKKIISIYISQKSVKCNKKLESLYLLKNKQKQNK